MSMRFPWRRREPAPPRVEDLAAEQVAVGSLTGVPPSDIYGHVLVVVTKDDGPLVIGSSMGPETTEVALSTALMMNSRRILAERASRGHGG